MNQTFEISRALNIRNYSKEIAFVTSSKLPRTTAEFETLSQSGRERLKRYAEKMRKINHFRSIQ